MWIRVLLLLSLLAGVAQAQRGDRPGDVQKLLIPEDIIPPAPVLSPEEALESFTLPPGFRIELVAAEPLVHDPVAMTFGPDGRIWVVEMRGFMPNVDGTGEDEPVGKVVVLEDTGGDGKMDKRTVFLDELVMPRALALVQDGLLVAEPPHVWFCRDTTGDGKADVKIVFDDDYGDQTNPEHTANGLMWALDNWIYSANHTARFRLVEGEWIKEETIQRGQWGITQDNYGRLVFNSNSDYLRGDFVPSHYLSRNPNHSNAAGANVQIDRDQTTWPIRVTPGINRGYQRPMLREDGTLARFTATCGPVVYRGDQFPAEYHGDVFVPEPSGNFIRRSILTERDGVLTGSNAYEEAEFLASTDERFRPVNMYNGPDGTLYIVDFYRGILQHRIYLTTYLRSQILSRGLEEPLGLGRIYRVVHNSGKPPGPAQPNLHNASPAELAGHLSHPNGWWRDTAQRLLVESADTSVAPALRKLAVSGENPLGRLHALYTLDGIGRLDHQTLLAALKDSKAKNRIAAIRLAEPFFESEHRDEILVGILELENDTREVQWQLAFTLGEIRDPRAEAAMIRLAHRNASNRYHRDALFSGVGGREVELLEQILADANWNRQTSGATAFLRGLARCIFTERDTTRVNRLFELAAKQSGDLKWRRQALLEGISSTAPVATQDRPAPPIRHLHFPSEPPGFAKLRGNPGKETELVSRVSELIAWPGKEGFEEETVDPLTPEQQQLFEQGRGLYAMACAACHQPSGLGMEGLAPPVRDTEWTLGSEDRLIRIMLQGASGPMTVRGRVYDLQMPGLEVLSDEQIAAVLTYIRREWGHTASAVDPESVARVREETAGRFEAWTEEELLKIP